MLAALERDRGGLTSRALTACSSSSPSGGPRPPQPAQELMAPVPTGSAYLESVSPELKVLGDDLAGWEQMLRGSRTK
ncbi:hypothetical protein [Bordetella genomosp. 5]|uniref:hypothetical protein n=1 Tax=Bordetella genomosp. 5 TaxID=1395608 RepID=UPI000B9E56E4|nr:hypothetical protein [Bordetella genomosp. 5]